MTAEKIITTTQEIDIDVIEITLLSVEEAMELDKNVRGIGDSWWLRSPGNRYYRAMFVDDGNIGVSGLCVDISLGARPALQISDLESSNLRIGDRFVLADEQWIVISKDKALCDRIIGKMHFRKYWEEPDANDYEKSDVKIWLEKWAVEKGVIQEVNRDDVRVL